MVSTAFHHWTRPTTRGAAAYLLDFHWREDKAGWWEYFELVASTEEELMDEPEAVAGLGFDSHVEVTLNKRTKKPTGTVVDRYRYPPQEMEIRRKAELKNRDGSPFGDVIALDRIARTIDVKKKKDQTELHPTAVFAHKYISSEVFETALTAIGDAVAPVPALNGAAGIRERCSCRAAAPDVRRVSSTRGPECFGVRGQRRQPTRSHGARDPGPARVGQDVHRRPDDLRTGCGGEKSWGAGSEPQSDFEFACGSRQSGS
jgi:hypothetical protein